LRHGVEEKKTFKLAFDIFRLHLGSDPAITLEFGLRPVNYNYGPCYIERRTNFDNQSMLLFRNRNKQRWEMRQRKNTTNIGLV